MFEEDTVLRNGSIAQFTEDISWYRPRVINNGYDPTKEVDDEIKAIIDKICKDT